MECFSCFPYYTGHANVEINNLDQLIWFIMRKDFLPTAISLFFQRLSDLTPRWATIYQIWQPYNLLHLKYPSIQLLPSALVKSF